MVLMFDTLDVLQVNDATRHVCLFSSSPPLLPSFPFVFSFLAFFLAHFEEASPLVLPDKFISLFRLLSVLEAAFPFVCGVWCVR